MAKHKAIEIKPMSEKEMMRERAEWDHERMKRHTEKVMGQTHISSGHGMAPDQICRDEYKEHSRKIRETK